MRRSTLTGDRLIAGAWCFSWYSAVAVAFTVLGLCRPPWSRRCSSGSVCVSAPPGGWILRLTPAGLTGRCCWVVVLAAVGWFCPSARSRAGSLRSGGPSAWSGGRRVRPAQSEMGTECSGSSIGRSGLADAAERPVRAWRRASNVVWRLPRRCPALPPGAVRSSPSAESTGPAQSARLVVTIAHGADGRSESPHPRRLGAGLGGPLGRTKAVRRCGSRHRRRTVNRGRLGPGC
jgi:hypothetical protein